MEFNAWSSAWASVNSTRVSDRAMIIIICPWELGLVQ